MSPEIIYAVMDAIKFVLGFIAGFVIGLTYVKWRADKKMKRADDNGY
jgi:hypothetical protein